MPERRTVVYQSMAEIFEDIRTLSEHGTPSSTGEWTAAQNVTHVTQFIHDSIDGFPIKAPLVLRLIGPLLKGNVLKKGIAPGKVKIPAGPLQDRYCPGPETSWESAYTFLKTTTERLANGERMTHRSPLFGKMTHEQWVLLHTKHAQMHFSFLQTA